MFCPKCGDEYREGFTVCSTCDVPLVKELPDQIKPEFIKFVTVYKTGNPAFIAFAKSIFESEGVNYYFKGEGIQDLFAGGRLGTGFNPVIGPVEIQVEEKEVEKAGELLEQIEKGEFEQLETKAEEDDAEESKPSDTKKHTFKHLIIGIIIGILISAIAFLVYDYKERHFSGVKQYDSNKDSKPDTFYHYKNGVVVRIEEDRDYDGKIDTWFSYKDGVLNGSEMDTNLDNKPEIVEYYRNGILSETLWYHESSRKIWKKALFAAGIKKEEYIDQDDDGTFDIKIIYDSSERPIRTDSLR